MPRLEIYASVIGRKPNREQVFLNIYVQITSPIDGGLVLPILNCLIIYQFFKCHEQVIMTTHRSVACRNLCDEISTSLLRVFLLNVC